VNAELLMFGAVPMTHSGLETTCVVLAMTAGQMTGKSFMYWVGRRATGRHASRANALMERWRGRFQSSPRSAQTLVFLSSLVGIPSFYVIAIAAGTLRIAFGRFLAVGTSGRLLHFGVVALAPQLISRFW
jgi:membrane protein YqaA with SNARE-associated domain